jgi:hypothetical protein
LPGLASGASPETVGEGAQITKRLVVSGPDATAIVAKSHQSSSLIPDRIAMPDKPPPFKDPTTLTRWTKGVLYAEIALSVVAGISSRSPTFGSLTRPLTGH